MRLAGSLQIKCAKFKLSPGAEYGSVISSSYVLSDWVIVWTISKERNRLEEQVSAGKLDPSKAGFQTVNFTLNIQWFHWLKVRKTNQKQFDFSEIYIFGKYENFVKRVSNINELLNTIQNFSSLKKCHIEGIEATNSNFDSIVESIKRKPYDILDHRKVM